jgi:hypothetical protein
MTPPAKMTSAGSTGDAGSLEVVVGAAVVGVTAVVVVVEMATVVGDWPEPPHAGRTLITTPSAAPSPRFILDPSRPRPTDQVPSR